MRTGFALGILGATTTLLWALSAAAQPEPLVASGEMVDGGVVSVTGSGFGFKGVPGPVIWDDFEQGSPGSDNIVGWRSASLPTGQKLPTYSDERPRGAQGMAVVNHWWTDGAPGLPAGGQYNSHIRWPVDIDFSTGYLSFWMRADTTRFGPAQHAGTENDKFQSWRTNNDGNYLGGPYLKPGAPELVNCNAPGTVYGVGDFDQEERRISDGWSRNGHITGIWDYGGQRYHRYESTVDFKGIDAPGSRHTISRDGDVWLSSQGVFATAEGFANNPNDIVYTHFMLPHYKRFCVEYSGELHYRLYFDEVYADTVMSRIELGDASTWNACNRREIQLPTAWSGSDLSFVLNQGELAAGQTAWIYVVDRNGNHNEEGLRVVLGGSGGDTTPPVLQIDSWSLNPADDAMPNPFLLRLQGRALDSGEVVSVTWSSTSGASGSASGTTNWSIDAIEVNAGAGETVTLTARDAAGNQRQVAFTPDQDVPAPVTGLRRSN